MAARTDLFRDRLIRRREKLTPAMLRIAEFIDANRLEVLTSSAIEIACNTGASDATVIRAVQALGFGGLPDLRRELAAAMGEGNAPVENLRRTLAEASDNIDDALDGMLGVYDAGLDVLRSASFRAAILGALEVLRSRTRIQIFGIGPTAHIVGYLAARLRRKGVRTDVIDRTGSELADQLLDLGPSDGLLMLAFGQPYREAVATAARARDLGIPIVLISDMDGTDLARQAAALLTLPRGRSGQIALNGITVLCLEMILLGLATADAETALSSLSELEKLRNTVRAGRRAPGDSAEGRAGQDAP